MHHARRIDAVAPCADQKRGQCRVQVRHVDAPAVLSRQRQEPGKAIERFAVGVFARREIWPLHPFTLNEGDKGAAIFCAGAQEPPPRFVCSGKPFELLAKRRPRRKELFRRGVVAIFRKRSQRARGVVDIADAAAHAERKIDGHVPGVIVLEIFEHFSVPRFELAPYDANPLLASSQPRVALKSINSTAARTRSGLFDYSLVVPLTSYRAAAARRRRRARVY